MLLEFVTDVTNLGSQLIVVKRAAFGARLPGGGAVEPARSAGRTCPAGIPPCPLLGEGLRGRAARVNLLDPSFFLTSHRVKLAIFGARVPANESRWREQAAWAVAPQRRPTAL